ncbi:MAG: ABC-2 family transporter protein [Candidatus Woesebacteria bacterium]|nr:ABC-2 family transporter protein [Candidatus Woesebacteria bacterium]
MKRYFKIWLLMSRNSFLAVFNQKAALTIFLVGKLIRFFFFFAFIVFLLKGTKSLAGYNLNQTLLFFFTFNLIDTISQFLFREVYRFRPLIVSGGFDLVLSKPINALFRSLMGGADVIDLITIIPLTIATFYVASLLNPSILHTTFYILLVLNGLVIASAFHIFVLGLGIVTLEIDHTIMIYRDLTALGRFPIDIYKEPLRGIITFLIPIGVMVSFPAKAIMGLMSPIGVAWSLVFGGLILFLSLKFWKFALKKYTSASS